MTLLNSKVLKVKNIMKQRVSNSIQSLVDFCLKPKFCAQNDRDDSQIPESLGSSVANDLTATNEQKIDD